MANKEAKKHYIAKHPLGRLTVAELKAKAQTEDILVYGDKAQILQCFDLRKQMTDLFRINKGGGHAPITK